MTNLPQQVDAPMPSPGADDMSDTDSDGKPIAEGKIYNWDDGTEARWQKGKWVAVKIRNRVCESAEDREKRLANEEERREAHQKKIAAAAAAKLAQTCKDWEQKHPVGGPPDFFPHDGSALDGAIMGSPEGCEGPLETAYNDRVKQEEASRQAAQQLAQQKANLTESARTSAIPTHQGWASVKNQYAPTITSAATLVLIVSRPAAIRATER